MPNEIETLRAFPAKRRVEAVELPDGRWLAASTDHASIIGEGVDLENAIVDLYDQAEQWTESRGRDQ